MPNSLHASALRHCACTATIALCAGCAAAQAPVHDRALPTSVIAGFERVELPGGERLGLVGAALLFEPAAGWWVGPAVYGAATGERGGLFVGGVEVQRRWRFGATQLAAGLYAGGGGGASAPVGDGLMLRPALTLLHDFGALQAGLSWSQVRFSGGDISSRQLGVVLAFDGTFRYAALERLGAPAAGDSATSGVGFTRLLGTATRYRLRDGDAPERRIGLVGVRLERPAGPFEWGLEGAAAASGDAAGYMELLGTIGGSIAPAPAALPAWRVGVRAALGLGGGAAVPTGGGVIGKLAIGTSWQVGRHWMAGIEAGRLRAPDTGLRAATLQGWLSADLEPGRGGGAVERSEWTASLQHHARTPRRDGSRRALQTVGLKFARFVGEHAYLTGQAHSAFGGGAGAYSIGLVGAGAASGRRPEAWRFGAELIAGAAGGGGVASGGGGVAQGLLWAGGSTTPGSEWRAGVGAMRYGRDGGTSPVVELAWSWAFGQAAP